VDVDGWGVAVESVFHEPVWLRRPGLFAAPSLGLPTFCRLDGCPYRLELKGKPRL